MRPGPQPMSSTGSSEAVEHGPLVGRQARCANARPPDRFGGRRTCAATAAHRGGRPHGGRRRRSGRCGWPRPPRPGRRPRCRRRASVVRRAHRGPALCRRASCRLPVSWRLVGTPTNSVGLGPPQADRPPPAVGRRAEHGVHAGSSSAGHGRVEDRRRRPAGCPCRSAAPGRVVRRQVVAKPVGQVAVALVRRPPPRPGTSGRVARRATARRGRRRSPPLPRGCRRARPRRWRPPRRRSRAGSSRVLTRPGDGFLGEHEQIHRACLP